MYQLYGTSGSGNCYKVGLLLTQLYLPFHWHEVEATEGGNRSALLMKKSRAGKLPILETPEGEVLSESNAILFFLAKGSDFLPVDSLEEAQVLQWMFWEQSSHEPNIAKVRTHYRQGNESTQGLEEYVAKGYDALSLMDRHLVSRPFFVGSRYSIADVALFAYSHLAEEAGFDLSPYYYVQQWLDRVSNQANFIPITSMG